MLASKRDGYKMEKAKQEHLRVSQMAKLNHVTAEQLRYYDRFGLLRPHYINPENGYRYYHISQSAVLDRILYLQGLGMNLKTIREFLDEEEQTKLNANLQEEIAKIDEELQLLQCKKASIERFLQMQEIMKMSPPIGEISIEEIEERRIFVIDTKTNFFAHDILTYEKILREVKKNIIQQDLPDFYFSNVSTIWRKEKFLHEVYDSHEFFIHLSLNRSIPDKLPRESVEILEEGKYLLIYSDHFDKEKAYAKKLLQYIKEHKLKTKGDYICEVLADLPPGKQAERRMFFRLQIALDTK